MKSAKTFILAATLIAGISVSNGQNQADLIPAHWKTSCIESELSPIEQSQIEFNLGLFSTLDSASTHYFRPAVVHTFKNTGDSLWKYEYFYDSTGMGYDNNTCLIENQYIYDQTNHSWKKQLQLNRVFDENRNIIANYTAEGDDENNWKPRARISLGFDERGNNTDWKQATWTENGWFDYIHSVISYDDQNRKIKEDYTMRASGQDWTPTSLFFWEYNEKGLLTKVEVQVYSGGEYETSQLTEYEYDDNGNQTVVQQSSWGKKTSRIERTYDASNNQTSELTRQYVDSIGEWVDTYRSDYSYDTFNRLQRGFLLVNSLGSWDSTERITMTYNYGANGYGNEKELSEKYNDSLKAWEGYQEQTWYYAEPGKGKLTGYTRGNPHKGWNGYPASWEEKYTYDQEGNLTKQLWENITRDTIMSASSIQRTTEFDMEASYDSLGNGYRVEASVKPTKEYIFINYNHSIDQWGCSDYESYAADIQYIDLREFVEAERMEIDSTSLNMLVNDTRVLHAQVLPTDASNPSIAWIVADPEIACVDGHGNVYALAEGETTITARSSYNPSVSAICTVTVASPEEPTPDPDPQANEESDMDNFRVWSRDRILYVESNDAQAEIFVIDMNGRLLYKGHATEIPVENSGLYIVRQGNNVRKTIIH